MQRNTLAAWRKAMEECGLSADFYVHRELPFNKPLPWSALDSGVDLDYLKGELDKARGGIETPSCPPVECHKCGVC
jgi:hypothetical protein